MNFREFLTWESTTKDTIDFKKIYVDVAGDFMAGAFLSQLVYWYLPDKNGKTKLRVQKDGHFWVAKTNAEWYEETRLTRANIETAARKLAAKGLVVKRHYKFNSLKTNHYRLDMNVFMELLKAEIEKQSAVHEIRDEDFYDYLEKQTGQPKTEPETPKMEPKADENTAEPYGPIGRSESSRPECANPADGNARIQQTGVSDSSRPITESTKEHGIEDIQRISNLSNKDSKKPKLDINEQKQVLGLIDTIQNAFVKVLLFKNAKKLDMIQTASLIELEAAFNGRLADVQISRVFERCLNAKIESDFFKYVERALSNEYFGETADHEEWEPLEIEKKPL